MEKLNGRQLTSADPEFRDNPHPIYDRLRSSDTLPVIEDYGCCFVTAYADVMQGLKDKTFSVDARRATEPSYIRRVAGTGVRESIGDAAYEPPLVLLDDPAHRHIRALVSKAFNPGRIEAMRPRIEAISVERLDAFEGRKQIDFIADFAAPLPTLVILEMMGLPLSHCDAFKRWSENILWGYDPDRGRATQNRLRDAYIGMAGVFREALLERRNSSADDLISALARAHDEDASLSELQIISLCTQLMVAGNVTTTDLMGNGVFALATHPEQQTWLAQHPEAMTDAVEEMLRFDCPITETARIPLQDATLAGCPIRAGDTLTLSLAAANRDPDVFEQPHAFDIRRQHNPHVGFGSGIHVCLGAPLARLESQIGLGHFMARHPDFRLHPQRPGKRRALPFFRGFETLPLLLG